MKLKSITASCFLIAALSLSAAPIKSAPALDTMKDLAATANDAADQAASLQSDILSPGIGWEVYATKLDALKDDVNDIGRTVSRLESMRDSLSAADREVIDHSMAMLKSMAANTTAAIEYLNHNRQNFWTPGYRGYISSLVNETDQFAHSLNQTVSLDKTRAREQSLEKSLDQQSN